MRLVKGSCLTEEQKRNILRAFPYRLTTENGYPQRNPCGASVPAISDSEWIDQHAFYLRKDGNLASKPNRCEPSYMAEEGGN